MSKETNQPPLKKILIIDDDYAIREFLETLLQEEYNVFKVENAVDARMILRDPVDLIILDIMLPNFDGYAFCKELKSSIATKHIPILIFTAKHQLSDLQPAIDAGMDEYLTKPFDADYLMKRIRVLLEKIPEEIPEQGKLLGFGGGFHYIRKK